MAGRVSDNFQTISAQLHTAPATRAFLLPALADRYQVVAPDLPGFGFSDAPDGKQFHYTFDHLAKIIASFTDAIGPKSFAI